MVRLVSRTRREGPVTLVEAALVNDGPLPRRVRVESRLDGPVWPPRRRGVPESGWDGRTYAVALDAGERLGFGFASPAQPVDPPVALVADDPPAFDATPDTPADVVRALGDPAPPTDAVALPEPDIPPAAGGDGPPAPGPDRPGPDPPERGTDPSDQGTDPPREGGDPP
ncbi:hypothetical protein BRD00_11375 [Halobacteriales archaeon QS_8_69_26]|nr:MAG: hypothetical protein BRD00_11375 [Halobacteriales archaeon QS_8_69_26]